MAQTESVWFWSGGYVNGMWNRALVAPKDFDATLCDIRKGGRIAVVNVGAPTWRPTAQMLSALR